MMLGFHLAETTNMKNTTLFTSDSNNQYLYADRAIYYVSPALAERLNKEAGYGEDDYYIRKLRFLRDHSAQQSEQHSFTTRIEPDTIKNHLGNLRQFLIEVTDDCNLACEYCGYRELYTNYDARSHKQQSFERVRQFVDFLAGLWKSHHNLSYNNTVIIGFYGGEPLMNMNLIKRTIEYIEGLKLEHILFKYNMTTNAMLLHKHIDYLQAKRFNILISLDGNKAHHSYRVTKGGENSFDQVFANVKKAQEQYPDFFDEYVNFNAVLHNRNSFKEVHDFILEAFSKPPRVSELSTYGVDEDKMQEFSDMFQSRLDSARQQDIERDLADTESLMGDPEVSQFNNFLDSFIGNTYDDLGKLLYPVRSQTYLPTGTCQPFQRKMFLTVNGKMLPCEKVGQERPIGHVTDQSVEVNFEAISDFYSDLYFKVLGQCEKCFQWNNCGQCIFLLKEKQDKLACFGFMTKDNAGSFLSKNTSLAEGNPFLHTKLVEEIIKD